MNTKSFLIAFSLYPAACLASDFTPLVYLFSFQFLVIFWPFIVPLVFLKGQSRKLRAYLVQVFVVFGTLGVLHFPMTVLASMLVIWPTLNLSFLFTVSSTIGLFAAPAVLYFYGKRILKVLDADKPQEQM